MWSALLDAVGPYVAELVWLARKITRLQVAALLVAAVVAVVFGAAWLTRGPSTVEGDDPVPVRSSLMSDRLL